MKITWCMAPEIWSTTDIIFLHFGPCFCPFTLLLTPKIKIWRKCKKTLTILSFTHAYHKWRSYDVCSWDIKVRRTVFFVVLGHFFPFDPPKNLKNQNFEKHEKTAWRYHHSTLAYHKWWSYNVWSLRYGAQQTEFFDILDYFLPFDPL